jgi:hypothetical protein
LIHSKNKNERSAALASLASAFGLSRFAFIFILWMNLKNAKRKQEGWQQWSGATDKRRRQNKLSYQIKMSTKFVVHFAEWICGNWRAQFAKLWAQHVLVTDPPSSLQRHDVHVLPCWRWAPRARTQGCPEMSPTMSRFPAVAELDVVVSGFVRCAKAPDPVLWSASVLVLVRTAPLTTGKPHLVFRFNGLESVAHFLVVFAVDTTMRHPSVDRAEWGLSGCPPWH